MGITRSALMRGGFRLISRDRSALVIRVLLIADVLVGGLLAFCLGPGPAWVEARARGRLQRALGPASAYAVEVGASWIDLAAGDVPVMRFNARDLTLPDGLQVDRLDARVEGMHLQGSRITALTRVAFRARILQSALNRYLPIRPKRLPLEPRVSLTLTEGRVEVRSANVLLSLALPLRAIGRLQVTSPTRLTFTVDQGSFGVERLPEMLRALTVLDLDDSPFGVRIRSLRVGEGCIEVDGDAAPPLPLEMSAAASGASSSH
ncbi:MAG: DUF2993 domain-containing protein [Proteobacteria bacterium]|nr:DUF2993 domain-containing protein [Pseudomonadota bacterium]